MVVLLHRRAARYGHWCTKDGASATFSTPGNVLSSRDLLLAVTALGAHTAEREPARTQADPLRTPGLPAISWRSRVTRALVIAVGPPSGSRSARRTRVRLGRTRRPAPGPSRRSAPRGCATSSTGPPRNPSQAGAKLRPW